MGGWIYVQSDNEVRSVICFLAVRPTGALRSHFLLFLFFTAVAMLLHIIIIIIIIIVVASFLALLNIFMYLR